jgi:thymidylate synthase (FAD)
MEKSMNVNLIGITKPTAYSGCNTVSELVAYTARVSNPANQNNNQTAAKLIKYLLKHRHVSPFEMVHATMEIKTTRDIARQILRHRSFSFQEFSQRYAEATGFINDREARLQDHKNRQNSIEINDRLLQEQWNMMQQTVIDQSENVYKWALNNGIAKEQARAVLPEGLTESTMYMAGNLRSWIHYIDVRTDPSTQKEHRLIAEQCKDIILQHFPILQEYFDAQSQNTI